MLDFSIKVSYFHIITTLINRFNPSYVGFFDKSMSYNLYDHTLYYVSILLMLDFSIKVYNSMKEVKN